MEDWERQSDELLVYPGDPGLFDIIAPGCVFDSNLRADQVRVLAQRNGWRIVEG